jgi:hypothetical protein
MTNQKRCSLRYKRLCLAGLCINCGKQRSGKHRRCNGCRFVLSIKYQSLKRVAKKKGLDSMTFEEYKRKMSFPLCFYGGQPLEPSQGSSLDRADSSKGYTFENTIPCCWKHNIIKAFHLTVFDMLLLMEKGNPQLKVCGNHP